MQCKKCLTEKNESYFYNSDKTCKECRKEMVRNNRALKADYYRNYDKKRYREDERVAARIKRYQETEAGKIAISKAKKKWKEKNPIKRYVHILTGNAIRSGALIKEPCEVCGSTIRIHAHHDDYSKPLAVRWLCAAHHKQWHDQNGEALNAS